MKRILLWIVVAGVALLVLIQFIPVSRTNPPVTREIAWDSAETRSLAERACFDCHSNETKWPGYAYIAPASLLLQDHVTEGRDAMNFSEWDEYYVDYDEIEENVQRGQMPPQNYLWMHPEARLTDAEKTQLLAGMAKTIEQDPLTAMK